MNSISFGANYRMAKSVDQTNLLIIGVHSHSDGYPNVKFRIKDLESTEEFDVTEIQFPIFDRFSNVLSGYIKTVIKLILFLYAHVKCWVYLLTAKKFRTTYIPYPAILVAASFSLLPKRKRPTKVVLDAFISPYDTIVNDRKLLSRSNPLAKLLKRIERHAYTIVDTVVVDTPQNVHFMAETFSLSPKKFEYVPLSTNEIDFKRTNTDSDNETSKFTVLFVGTLIPLHGIEVILEAISMLKNRINIRFEIVGNGQMGYLVEKFIAINPESLVWVSSWQSSQELNERISHADLCLGIFGYTEKADRVCPLKVYAYTRCGKPVISGESAWMQYTRSSSPNFPFITIPHQDAARELADQIGRLADCPDLIERMGISSAEFYETTLSNQLAMNKLKSILNRS